MSAKRFITIQESFSVPDMAGKRAYFACPDYDRFEIYNWKHDHWETLAELENEIYENLPELDRAKDALNYTGGIKSVNGIDRLSFCFDSVIGENATFWRISDYLYTDGDLESHPYEIWIFLKEPRQIYIYD